MLGSGCSSLGILKTFVSIQIMDLLLNCLKLFPCLRDFIFHRFILHLSTEAIRLAAETIPLLPDIKLIRGQLFRPGVCLLKDMTKCGQEKFSVCSGCFNVHVEGNKGQ